ncbi:MAG: dTMP kinase, partial [Vicinamibacterales bacterium]
MSGHLIAFEGLDQSGKETQAQRLRDALKATGHKARFLTFPDYGTSIGEEIARALQGERDYGPDVMQLLFIANRYERKPEIERWLEGGLVLLCDRYL